MSNPRDFFEKMVKPSYGEWRAEPLLEHRARALIGFANDMADWMFHHLGLERDYGARGEAKYRDELADECPDFGLLRDIADGTKHFRLGRANRTISNANQTGRGTLSWDKCGERWEDADYTWEESGDLLMATADNGEQRSLISIVNNVMLMWERLLGQKGL